MGGKDKPWPTSRSKGNPIHTVGELSKVGRAGPKFGVTRGDLSDIPLADFEGKVEILNIVPSLDTGLGGGLGAPLREGGGRPRLAHDTTFLEGLDRAFYWQRLIDEGIVKSGSEIARREG